MIGRYAKSGVYQELLLSRDFLRAAGGATLGLIGWFIGRVSTNAEILAQALILTSVVINGVPVIIQAVKGLIAREANVDELLSLALIACLLQGEFFTAAVVSAIMVMGALIEEAAAESARKSIQSLVQITPKKAMLITDGRENEVAVEDVKKGDMLRVNPGSQIPVDAKVVEGHSSIDESAITGEPLPVEKSISDMVYAGTMNHNGSLIIKAEKVGEETTLGRVIQLVIEAENHSPQSISFVDRFAGWFTPLILTCAALAWGISGEFGRAVTVLIVGCPCALILAVPTATVASIGRAAKAGILVKGGQHLEGIALADTIIFDKTGTLTEGKPRIDEVIPTENISRKELIALAASVEQNANHPLARAVMELASREGIAVTAAKNITAEIGRGVQGTLDGSLIEVGSFEQYKAIETIPQEIEQALANVQQRGATPLLVSHNKKFCGFLAAIDSVRQNAAKDVAKLHQLSLQTAILSGDHNKAVARVGTQIGIDNFTGGLKPEDKLCHIKEKQKTGCKVIFVGDGINDAPALAAADTGIAMGGKGTEAALESADIALMGDDIAMLPFLVRLSRRMLFIIKLNIVIGIAFNAIAVLAGAAGFLSPIEGAVVHNVGSVLVVLLAASMALLKE